jgi:hypothetical protein
MSRPTPLREVECPRCKTHLAYRRKLVPQFDSSGFESLELECSQCGASLAGVIDPYDGELLLSTLEEAVSSKVG